MKKMTNFKISKKLIKNVFILAILIEPMGFQDITLIDKIYNILKVLTLLYIIADYIKLKKYSKFTLLTILFNLTLLLSTIINKGDIMKCIGVIANTMGLILFTEIMLMENIDLMFNSYIKLLEGYMIINTFTLLLPNGITNFTNVKTLTYFLGIDNRFIFYYIPLIYFKLCYSYYKFNKLQKSDIVVYIICLLTLVYKWSVGSMVGLLFYIPFVLFIEKIKNKTINKRLNLFFYFTIILLVNYLIIIVQFQYVFEGFIVNVLKKDITFSERTIIWENTLEYIKMKPILGNGYETVENTMHKLHGANHPHNYFLCLLYRGGITYFLEFVFMIFLSANKLKKYPNNKMGKVISFSILISLIMCIFDSFDFAAFLVMIQLGYHIDIFVKKKNNNLVE